MKRLKFEASDRENLLNRIKQNIVDQESMSKDWIPGGPVTPLKDNPKAQSHYRKLIEAGIEDAADFPEIDMTKARKKKSARRKTKRKSKKKGCGCA